MNILDKSTESYNMIFVNECNKVLYQKLTVRYINNSFKVFYQTVVLYRYKFFHYNITSILV